MHAWECVSYGLFLWCMCECTHKLINSVFKVFSHEFSTKRQNFNTIILRKTYATATCKITWSQILRFLKGFSSSKQVLETVESCWVNIRYFASGSSCLCARVCVREREREYRSRFSHAVPQWKAQYQPLKSGLNQANSDSDISVPFFRLWLGSPETLWSLKGYMNFFVHKLLLIEWRVCMWHCLNFSNNECLSKKKWYTRQPLLVSGWLNL